MYTLALAQNSQTFIGLPVSCDAAVWPTGLPVFKAGVPVLTGTVETTDARERIAMTNGHTFPGTRAWSPPT